MGVDTHTHTLEQAHSHTSLCTWLLSRQRLHKCLAGDDAARCHLQIVSSGVHRPPLLFVPFRETVQQRPKGGDAGTWGTVIARTHSHKGTPLHLKVWPCTQHHTRGRPATRPHRDTSRSGHAPNTTREEGQGRTPACHNVLPPTRHAHDSEMSAAISAWTAEATVLTAVSAVEIRELNFSSLVCCSDTDADCATKHANAKET
jgi:hypothetical protein